MLTLTAWVTRCGGMIVAVMLLVAVLPGPAASARIPHADFSSKSIRWAWPVGPPFGIVRSFIAPVTPYSSGHRGIDIGGADGGDVVAPAAGIVHFAGWVVNRPVVSLRHPNGLISSFEPVTSTLAEGTAVARGQVIGRLEPGHCATACLHFGVRRHGEYVSPLLYLAGIPRSVLLPTRTISH